jgi:kynurenine 3-monooxygenase
MSESKAGRIAIVGGGPAGLVAAIALARRGIPTTVLERDAHPELTSRFNPDRSYTIDITGHGLRALRHIDATSAFDERLIRFKGLQYEDRTIEQWTEPGWTGSRGDIQRALMSVVTDRHQDQIHMEFGCRVQAVDVLTGAVTFTPPGGTATTSTFDLVIGADGAGSVVRAAMHRQLVGFTVQSRELPNYLTMIELDRLDDQLDENYLQALATRPFCMAGPSRATRGPAARAGSAPSEPDRGWPSPRLRTLDGTCAATVRGSSISPGRPRSRPSPAARATTSDSR